jgi:hypothetical protein
LALTQDYLVNHLLPRITRLDRRFDKAYVIGGYVRRLYDGIAGGDVDILVPNVACAMFIMTYFAQQGYLSEVSIHERYTEHGIGHAYSLILCDHKSSIEVDLLVGHVSQLQPVCDVNACLVPICFPNKAVEHSLPENYHIRDVLTNIRARQFDIVTRIPEIKDGQMVITMENIMVLYRIRRRIQKMEKLGYVIVSSQRSRSESKEFISFIERARSHPCYPRTSPNSDVAVVCASTSCVSGEDSTCLLLSCTHVMHKQCLMKVLALGVRTCPSCTSRLSVNIIDFFAD